MAGDDDAECPSNTSMSSVDTRDCVRRAILSTEEEEARGNMVLEIPQRRSIFNFWRLSQRAEAVQRIQICNSRSLDEDIEIEQVWMEYNDASEDDDQGENTSFTNESTSNMETFHERIGQPLVFLKQNPLDDVGMGRAYKSTKLRVVYLPHVPEENAPEYLKQPDMLNNLGQLLDAEYGRGQLFCKRPAPEQQSVSDLNKNLQKEPTRSSQAMFTSEVGILGRAWRGVLKTLLLFTMDDVNRLGISRVLQIHLSFLTGFESFLLSQLIEALERGRNLPRILHKALQNRNVSRLLVQSLGPRYDFIFHIATAVSLNSLFDALGNLPVVGSITRFPATENFPSTRNHALASIFRVVLGQGNWLTRVLTGGREGLITDDPGTPAQNLAAESNGFELANRNQYGTHFGRIHTNKFRLDHRLPTDESLIRSFVIQPTATMTNNGAVHMLRQLAKHWENMLGQEYGNFAHQRMEQLDPFETLRFNIPEVLLVLSSLRGRNVWDSTVMAPMISRLQSLRPQQTTNVARRLALQLQLEIVVPVCGGLDVLVRPFQRWLDAILLSLDRIEQSALEVYNLLESVELGIRLGHDIMAQVNWKVPSDRILQRAIESYIRGDHTPYTDEIASALERTTPRDKRTLVELFRKGLEHLTPTRLLLSRTKTLLQRELRRKVLNRAIQDLSRGELVSAGLKRQRWYWVEAKKGLEDLYEYLGKSSDGGHLRFRLIQSGATVRCPANAVLIRSYVPVAEAISRAQKMFMTLELAHGRYFTYNAFMEFTSLRKSLRRLSVVAQMACDALDNARLNLLSEVQKNPLKAVEPQNLIVVGGGPAGLMTCLHCTENCLASGGVVKLFEARDTFAKGGSTYERAQIVRLDARWIAMMRYHLGTGFEDIFIPASGETDSQLGNTLPTQNFVEITIKDLENLLHVEISRFWSRGVISVFTDARAQYDSSAGTLVKRGENLKIGDIVLRNVDVNGLVCNKPNKWIVDELIYTELLGVDDLRVGGEYGVYSSDEKAVLPFLLLEVDLETKVYHFKARVVGVDDIFSPVHDLPSVYPAETRAHAGVCKIRFRHTEANNKGTTTSTELLAEIVNKEVFLLALGETHVVEAIGKPHELKNHFCVTTDEPYGVCCLEGLKVSMGMHKFGEKRWNSGIVDDIRSTIFQDQNTRIVGDFTKMLRVAPAVKYMCDTLLNDSDWVYHFNKVVADSAFPNLNGLDPIVSKIISACEWLAVNSKNFHRQTLQTRFFEVGDNFYLGMELPREYVQWKTNLTDQLVQPLKKSKSSGNNSIDALKEQLGRSVDRLWFFACLETIRTGDVYNPGAKRRVPKLHLISSNTSLPLRSLSLGESFRFHDNPKEKYEILAKRGPTIVTRNVEGYVFRFGESLLVRRESNLTRSPDGNNESKVSIATFPLAHYVNHRTMRVSDADRGTVFAFTGDEQATPHFMRYSGLTGAAVNAMSFNKFLERANQNESFIERMKEYSKETNWSNGEVVQRGTGHNYGVDGFLRPGFSYDDLMDYLFSKVMEYKETGQDCNNLLSRDWKTKLSASVIPVGMELNEGFASSLLQIWQEAVYKKLVREIADRGSIKDQNLSHKLQSAKHVMDKSKACTDEYWDAFESQLALSQKSRLDIEENYLPILKVLNKTCFQLIDFAAKGNLYDERISSELTNQPLPVDSLVDDFAVEAQSFANSLTLAAAFGSGVLAFRLVHEGVADLASALLGAINILIAFATMTNVSRYKIRNEASRIEFMDSKLLLLEKAVFRMLGSGPKQTFPIDKNPFLNELDDAARAFQRNVVYYGLESSFTEFKNSYKILKQNAFDVEKLKQFKIFLSRKILLKEFQTNSYVQESIVRVYCVLENWISCIEEQVEEVPLNVKASELFLRIGKFKKRLEPSLQRGPVRLGFLKQRKFYHMDICIALRFFYSVLWRCTIGLLPPSGCHLAPIEQETVGMLRHIHRFAKFSQSNRLSRETRDMEELYWATRESGISSVIFVVSALTFATSLVFTFARIFRISVLTDLAFFTAAASTLGAALALFHFVRKSVILTKLWTLLHEKDYEVPDVYLRDLYLVRRVTLIQLFLTVTRLLAASASAVALPFAFAELGYTDHIPTVEDLPFWIATAAIGVAIGAAIVFLVVEYTVRYRLPTSLGPLVCNIFRVEIAEIYETMKRRPTNTVETKNRAEKEAWVYTARAFLHRYRFDTVFAADRVGQILQYIQSGQLKTANGQTSDKGIA